jgi:hypothetical protein
VLIRLQEGENGTLKAQRLNVDFSLAKESIRFVLSKKPEEIQHEAGRVLQFFKNMLDGLTMDLAIIRLNKFVIRDNPIQYLDRQFARIFKFAKTEDDDGLSKEVAETYEKIESKQIKKCGKYGQMKDLSEFYDPNLATLYGRNCTSFKGKEMARSR